MSRPAFEFEITYSASDRRSLQPPGKGWEVLEKLKSDEKLTGVKSAKEGLADMELLFGYLDVMGVLDKVRLGSQSAQVPQLTTSALHRCPST